jgi:hypothetical protein
MPMTIARTLGHQPFRNIEIKGSTTATASKSQMLSLASRLFRHFFGKRQTIGFMPAELERMDIGYEELTPFDYEALLIENGRFVGNTATVNNGNVKPTEGDLPSGYHHTRSGLTI